MLYFVECVSAEKLMVLFFSVEEGVFLSGNYLLNVENGKGANEYRFC